MCTDTIYPPLGSAAGLLVPAMHQTTAYHAVATPTAPPPPPPPPPLSALNAELSDLEGLPQPLKLSAAFVGTEPPLLSTKCAMLLMFGKIVSGSAFFEMRAVHR